MLTISIFSSNLLLAESWHWGKASRRARRHIDRNLNIILHSGLSCGLPGDQLRMVSMLVHPFKSFSSFSGTGYQQVPFRVLPQCVPKHSSALKL